MDNPGLQPPITPPPVTPAVPPPPPPVQPETPVITPPPNPMVKKAKKFLPKLAVGTLMVALLVGGLFLGKNLLQEKQRPVEKQAAWRGTCAGTWTCSKGEESYTYQCSRFTNSDEGDCTGGKNGQGNFCVDTWTRSGGCSWTVDRSGGTGAAPNPPTTLNCTPGPCEYSGKTTTQNVTCSSGWGSWGACQVVGSDHPPTGSPYEYFSTISCGSNDYYAEYVCGGSEASPSPSPTTTAFLDGWLDAARCSLDQDVVVGWAGVSSKAEVPVDVHFYFDGPAGSGVGFNAGSANVYRADAVDVCKALKGSNELCNACETNHDLPQCKHAFYLKLSDIEKKLPNINLRDGKEHRVYAYAVSSEYDNKELQYNQKNKDGVPGAFTCSSGGGTELSCMSLNSAPVADKLTLGDTATFTCEAKFSAVEPVAFFRYSTNGGTAYGGKEPTGGMPIDLTTNKASHEIAIDKIGDWVVQCQVCTDAAATSCTAWGQAK